MSTVLVARIPKNGLSTNAAVEQPGSGPNFQHKPARLESVDLLRGAVMIIMALDHVRDYVSGFPYSPTDLAHTTPGLFFTRWITHFCAPIFIFLAGTGSFLSLGRGKTTRELSRFLITRGLFLLVLEQTVMRLGWNFRLGAPLWSGILFAIGMSMIVLAGMIHLPRALMIGISLVMVLLHNTLDGFHAEFLGKARWLWAILHESGNFGHYADGAVVLRVLYPLIPWLGVMALGYAAGPIFKMEPARRHRVLYSLGIGLTLAFIALRWFDVYGNLWHRVHYDSAVLTTLSFFDVTKYPPSLDYLLMTLGPGIALLPLLEKAKGRVAQWVLVYGRVPMFYYVLHVYLAHTVGVLLAMGAGKPVPWLNPAMRLGTLPANSGFELWVVYAAWIFVFASLYPACKWWMELKRRRNDWWLGYL
ncbi:MAG: DUF1624 domain-containing protein [Terriglobales bacterium]